MPASCFRETLLPPSPRSPLLGLCPTVSLATAIVLPVLPVEALRQSLFALRRGSLPGVFAAPRIRELLRDHLLFAATVLVCLLPTFLTRYLIYGRPFESGYIPIKDWNWFSPNFLAVLFSSDHGLVARTPILLLGVVGLFLFLRLEPRIGAPLPAA